MSDDSERTKLRRDPDVVVTDLDDELVLLDPATQGMYTLNRVGREVWMNLDGRSATEVAEMVAERYGLEATRARQDVGAVVRELLDAGLAHAEGED